MWIFMQGLLVGLSLIHISVGANTLPFVSESRIINGSEVSWENTRYQVSVRYKERDELEFGKGHTCGGSLVAPNLVLTAAHCVWDDGNKVYRNASDFVIVMGNVDRTVELNSLKLDVREIAPSSTFDPATFRDDIAIMVLNEPVPDSYTRATLIELNENPNIEEGTLCLVSGWGITEDGELAQHLRALEAPILNRTRCSENYGSSIIQDGMMCAGYFEGMRDSCTADSGGPLMCDNRLVGIVSFGTGCALPKYPGVYTNVAKYIEWFRSSNESIQLRYHMHNTTNGTGTHSLNTATSFGYNASFISLMILVLSIFSKLMSLF
uniref:Putative trypsin-1-like protein n=1 Tax=Haematobia irritans TaxID=7368 RepID=A0A1L8EJE5_HAEIR